MKEIDKSGRLVYLSLALSLLALFIAIKGQVDLRGLYCDLTRAVFVEREYTYPILRTIDNPDNYGKGIYNPITTKQKYQTCD